MICTRYFNFIHVPKTGGMWVTHILREHVPPEWDLWESDAAHRGVVAVPPKYTGQPTIAFVRNPWDWYVSQFAYFQRRAHQDPSVEAFHGQLPQMLHRGAQWHTRPLITNQNRLACTVKRFEDNLRLELLYFLQRACGELLPRSLHDAVLEEPPRNQGNRRDYREYYDDGMVEAVRHTDSWLISKFGYEFAP